MSHVTKGVLAPGTGLPPLSPFHKHDLRVACTRCWALQGELRRVAQTSEAGKLPNFFLRPGAGETGGVQICCATIGENDKNFLRTNVKVRIALFCNGGNLSAYNFSMPYLDQY